MTGERVCNCFGQMVIPRGTLVMRCEDCGGMRCVRAEDAIELRDQADEPIYIDLKG